MVTIVNTLDETASKLKKAINQEKKHLQELDLVQKLIEAKIGDPGRLDYIKKALETENTLYESEKQYLAEKSKQLHKVVENQRKAELALQALDKLRLSELKDSERLTAIKKALQEGKSVAESEINFLNTKYEKLREEIDYQNKIKWTLDVIDRLHEEEIGDYAKLATMRSALEERRNVDQSEISYLKEKYKLLQQIDAAKMAQWAIDKISKLQLAEIGNYERFEKIKTALKEGKSVDQSDISYLKDKYEQFLIIRKSKSELDKNNTEDIEEEDISKVDTLTAKISELDKKGN